MKNIDKLYHFIAGFIIAVLFAYLYGVIYGYLAGFLAGVGKEAVDRYRYGGGDFFDFFATLFGAFVGVVAFGLIVNFI